MTEANHTLGEFIRQTRTQKGMSQRALALQAEIDPSYLKDIEYDRRSPSEAVLQRLANVLKVPARRLRELNVSVAMSAFRKMVENDRELNVLFIRLMNDLRNGTKNAESVRERFSGI